MKIIKPLHKYFKNVMVTEYPKRHRQKTNFIQPRGDVYEYSPQYRHIDSTNAILREPKNKIYHRFPPQGDYRTPVWFLNLDDDVTKFNKMFVGNFAYISHSETSVVFENQEDFQIYKMFCETHTDGLFKSLGSQRSYINPVYCMHMSDFNKACG